MVQQSEKYDLLLLEACACDTLRLLKEEVIVIYVSNIFVIRRCKTVIINVD